MANECFAFGREWQTQPKSVEIGWVWHKSLRFEALNHAFVKLSAFSERLSVSSAYSVDIVRIGIKVIVLGCTHCDVCIFKNNGGRREFGKTFVSCGGIGGKDISVFALWLSQVNI